MIVHRTTSRRAPDAVLFDRDGTLVVDVPYNGDPARAEPVPAAAAALDLLRAAGIPVGVVTNQSGIARGVLTAEQVDVVNRRVEALLGPFAVWEVCPHGPQDGCACRKPRPGLVLAAARRLGVVPGRTAVIGDIGADVEAAAAAGAAAVLVPTAVTRREEVVAAPVVRPDLVAAVCYLLGFERGAGTGDEGPGVDQPGVDRPGVDQPGVDRPGVDGCGGRAS